jgi:hypothetical protein
MLSPKENYLRCLSGEVPEYVPEYTLFAFPGLEEVANCILEPPPLLPHRLGGSDKDIFGVPYVGSESTMGAIMPANDRFILDLDDMPHWGDFIKTPDFSDIDWEQVVSEQFKAVNLDRDRTAVAMGLHFGYFQHLVSFMGFENCMIAFYEYPDEVHELFDYISDFFMDVCDKTIDLYKPDALCLMDDTASENSPFISPAMWKEFLFPYHDKFAKRGRERGLPMTFHNCGRAEAFIPLMRELGIKAWEPAQTANDLVGVKKTYGNDFIILGGWEGRGRLLEPMASPENPDGLTEEELRQSVRDVINTLAPGGGYCWMGYFMPSSEDDPVAAKNTIISDEAKRLRMDFYK